MYAAQAVPASTLNDPNRPKGSDTDPDAQVVAARPPGRNRPVRIATPPYRSSVFSAFALATANLPVVTRLPTRRPSR